MEVFRLMQRLKQIEAQNLQQVEVRFLWGNHDVWLMEANLFNDEDVMGKWLMNGGVQAREDFRNAGIGINELALFMLENFELFHDEILQAPECTKEEYDLFDKF